MNLRPLIPLASFSLAVGVLAGCGSPTEEQPGNRPLTIAELLGQTSYTDDEYRANEQQIQEIVADCMAELGWQYIPVTQPDFNWNYDEDDELERIQREGYGIVYWTLHQGDDIPYDDPWADWVDPNTAYVESLTDLEREAYYFDLYGNMLLYSEVERIVDPGEDWVDPDPSMEWERGCFGEASDEVYGEPPAYDEEYWEATNRFYEELNQRVTADPRIKELEKTWASCMKAAGLDYANLEEYWSTALADLQARRDEIAGDLYNQDPFEGWTQEQIDAFFETATQEQIDAMYENLYVLTDDQRSQLEVLLGEEIELAVAEFQCTKPYNTAYQEAYAAIEEEYAIEHRAEIEALLASHQGA